MKRGTAGLLLALLALGVGAGCGSDDSSKRDAAAAAARARAQAALHARRVALGRRVFATRCAFCHTIEGKVSHPTFIESPIPNLDEVKPRLRYVLERVESGGIDMPRTEVTDARMLAVATYVVEVSGSRIQDSGREEPEAVTLGERVFRANCESCHQIEGRRSTGTAAYPGTNFDVVKPSQRMVMDRILRGIDSEMPSFRGKLSNAELHAVAVYVTATAGE